MTKVFDDWTMENISFGLKERKNRKEKLMVGNVNEQMLVAELTGVKNIGDQSWGKECRKTCIRKLGRERYFKNWEEEKE